MEAGRLMMAVLFTGAPWNLVDQRTEASKLPFSNFPATSLPPSFQVVLNQVDDGDKDDDEIFDDLHQGLFPTRLPWSSTAWAKIPPSLWRTEGDLKI